MCVFMFSNALPRVGLYFVVLAERVCRLVLFCKLKPEVVFPRARLVDVGGADAM